MVSFPTSKTCCSTVRPSVPDLPPMNARYLMSIFVVSVLPAPLSPLTNIDWLPCSLIIALKIIISNKTVKNISHSMNATSWLSNDHRLQLHEEHSVRTCNKHPQSQRDGGWAPQRWRLCTAPSCARHTDEAASGKGWLQSRCSRCTSVKLVTNVRKKKLKLFFTGRTSWTILDEKYTHIYLVKTVTTSEVMQDSWFMEVSQLRHVVHSCRGCFRVFGVYTRKARHNLNPMIQNQCPKQ